VVSENGKHEKRKYKVSFRIPGHLFSSLAEFTELFLKELPIDKKNTGVVTYIYLIL
jgi:hypothetical protein